MRFRRILCPTDFTKPSQEALRFAIALAKDTGGALSLMHVGLGPGPARARREDGHLADLKRRAEAEGVKDVQVVQAIGKTVDQVLREARRCLYDLIVLGSRGRTGVKRAIRRSVAEDIVRRSPCPVLVVRSAHRDLVTGLSSSPPIDLQDIRTQGSA
jgi:nucleotide-binding universal stress UspA family protein